MPAEAVVSVWSLCQYSYGRYVGIHMDGHVICVCTPYRRGGMDQWKRERKPGVVHGIRRGKETRLIE